MTDPQIIIGLSAATGAVIGSLLTMALRGPRTVYVPVYSGSAPLRVSWERPARRIGEPLMGPEDLATRPKLGSMAEAYEAERKQLLQARREQPVFDAGEDEGRI